MIIAGSMIEKYQMWVGTLSRRVSVNMDPGTVQMRTHLKLHAVPK